MVVLGVIIFAGASALCGAAPRGSAAEAWLVVFRAVQGWAGRSCSAAIAIAASILSTCAPGAGAGAVFGIAGGADRDRPDRGVGT